MNFFLDENFPKKATIYLEEEGYKVFDIRGTDKEGANDFEIFKIAQINQSIFLTTDKDFYHTINFHYNKHCGIIVIALSQPNSNQIIEKLKSGIECKLNDSQMLVGKDFFVF